MKTLKNLPTFIDLSKQMKDMNYIEHPKVQQIMQHLKYQDQNIKLSQEKQQIAQQIINISKQLEIELDNMEDEDKSHLIDLLKLHYTPQQLQDLIKQSANTLQTHYNLHRIQQKMSNTHYIKKTSLTENELLSQFSQINFLSSRNSDSQEFYKYRFTQRKPLKNEMSLEDKFQILKGYLKERGIIIGRKESVPNQEYLHFYHEQTNKLIRQTQQQQMLKFGLLLKTQPDTPSPRKSLITKDNSNFKIKKTLPNDVEKWHEFINNTEAIQKYYLQETNKQVQIIENLENTLERPYMQHFNKILTGEEEPPMKVTYSMKPRKNDIPRRLRMQRIFKSEL